MNWIAAVSEAIDGPLNSSDVDSEGDDNDFTQEDITEKDIPVGADETLCGSDGIRMAPGEGSSPLSLLTDEDSEALSFPKIFIGEQMKQTHAGKQVSYITLIKSLFRHHDPRAVRTDFLFYMDTKRVLQTLVSKVSIMLRKSKSGLFSPNASTVLNENNVHNRINSDEAFLVFNTVRNKEDITEDQESELPSSEIFRLIQSDAPTCARYFDQRFRFSKATWKPPQGPFGNFEILDYYCRIEFQARSSRHVHMMAWLKDAPLYTVNPDNEYKVCAFVDFIITCKHADQDEDPLTYSYLLEKGNEAWGKKDDELDDTELQLKEHSTMNFDEFLAEINMNLDDYLKAIQASISSSKVMLKRNVNEILINNYNPLILKMHRANIDLQFILGAYACCIHIVNYINKSNKTKNNLDDVDCEDVFKANSELITNNIAEFSKIPDQTLLSYMQEAERRRENDQNNETNTQDFNDASVDGNDVNNFKMYSMPEGVHLDVLAESNRFVRPDKLDNYEYYKLVSNLNTEQRDCFNHIINHVRQKDIPLHIFITGVAGTGKSLLIETLYQALVRFYDAGHKRDFQKVSVILCAFTGKAAFNINSQTIHSLFHLPINRDNIQDLSADVANSISVDLAELQVIILDEISMISSRQTFWIDKRLKDAFRNDKHFAGKHVLVLGDFLQLPPVHDFAIYSGFPNNPIRHIKLTELWHTFEVQRLTEIMRQKDDANFSVALKNMARGIMTKEDIELFQKRTFKALPPEAARENNLIRLYPTNKLVNECDAETLSIMSKKRYLPISYDCGI
ncbi:hypothetical protein INT47_007394 [Mucor saturninus]|uniref:ATP-dependent DNA helicase n=1 Tax=Mucor saturninus TaxID=64648 RepID=A0A8H7QL60_9FUNG|nr:hypothetical protein INT47_007394 [Mucor saturninus]